MNRGNVGLLAAAAQWWKVQRGQPGLIAHQQRQQPSRSPVAFAEGVYQDELGMHDRERQGDGTPILLAAWCV